MSEAPGIARMTYLDRCALLGIEAAPLDSPVARQEALPIWLTEELICTAAARTRLRAWSAAGGKDTQAERRAIVDRVAIVGESTLRALAVDVLLLLPACVLDHVRRHAVVLVVGRQDAGFAWSESAVPADATEHRRFLNCSWSGSDEAFRTLVAHEAAHHWLLDGRPREVAPVDLVAARETRTNFVRYAASVGLLDRVARMDGDYERQASALTRAWGLTGPGADSCIQVAAARRRVVDEAARLVEEDDGREDDGR